MATPLVKERFEVERRGEPLLAYRDGNAAKGILRARRRPRGQRVLPEAAAVFGHRRLRDGFSKLSAET